MQTCCASQCSDATASEDHVVCLQFYKALQAAAAIEQPGLRRLSSSFSDPIRAAAEAAVTIETDKAASEAERQTSEAGKASSEAVHASSAPTGAASEGHKASLKAAEMLPAAEKAGPDVDNVLSNSGTRGQANCKTAEANQASLQGRHASPEGTKLVTNHQPHLQPQHLQAKGRLASEAPQPQPAAEEVAAHDPGGVQASERPACAPASTATGAVSGNVHQAIATAVDQAEAQRATPHLSVNEAQVDSWSHIPLVLTRTHGNTVVALFSKLTGDCLALSRSPP